MQPLKSIAVTAALKRAGFSRCQVQGKTVVREGFLAKPSGYFGESAVVVTWEIPPTSRRGDAVNICLKNIADVMNGALFSTHRVGDSVIFTRKS